MSYKFHIGIDPDIKESGFALWEGEEKWMIFVKTMPFFDVIDYLGDMDKSIAQVHIESSWLIKTTQWAYNGKAKGISDLISKKVGQNRQIGLLFEEYCKRLRIDYILHKPSTTKISVKTFRNLTKFEGNVTQDSIDAAMLVFGI